MQQRMLAALVGLCALTPTAGLVRSVHPISRAPARSSRIGALAEPEAEAPETEEPSPTLEAKLELVNLLVDLHDLKAVDDRSERRARRNEMKGRIDECVKGLCATPEKREYSDDLLDGCWVLAYAHGGRIASLAHRALLGGRKRQIFDTADSTIRNVVTIGSNKALHTVVKFAPTAEPAEDGGIVRLEANISEACLKYWSIAIPVPLRGQGYMDLLYVDEDVRVTRGNRGRTFVHFRPDSMHYTALTGAYGSRAVPVDQDEDFSDPDDEPVAAFTDRMTELEELICRRRSRVVSRVGALYGSVELGAAAGAAAGATSELESVKEGGGEDATGAAEELFPDELLEGTDFPEADDLYRLPEKDDGGADESDEFVDRVYELASMIDRRRRKLSSKIRNTLFDGDGYYAAGRGGPVDEERLEELIAEELAGGADSINDLTQSVSELEELRNRRRKRLSEI